MDLNSLILRRFSIVVMVVLRSPIHANKDYDLYSVVEFSVRCAVEHAIVFTWLICMNGTSQYHHYPIDRDYKCVIYLGTVIRNYRGKKSLAIPKK